MGRVEQLIDDHFQKRFVMYVGRREFACVSTWIAGFDYACQVAFPDEVSDLKGFREWLLLNLGGTSNVGWEGIIQEHHGAGDDATAKFFELFLRFRADIRQHGLKQILKEHLDYEIEKYGRPVSSEYYTRGWDKR